MDAEEIANRIALLWNPMPDMSGRQINRLHGRQRQLVEDLAKEIADESAAMLAAERERCATVADQMGQGAGLATSRMAYWDVALMIRNLPPQADGGPR